MPEHRIQLTAEVLGMTRDNADGTARQTHATACRPGDVLALVPMPASAERGRSIAVLSLAGQQIGRLPAVTVDVDDATSSDGEALAQGWRCRVARVARHRERLRIIVRLERRIAAADDDDARRAEIEELCEVARAFKSKRQCAGRARDERHTRRGRA